MSNSRCRKCSSPAQFESRSSIMFRWRGWSDLFWNTAGRLPRYPAAGFIPWIRWTANIPMLKELLAMVYAEPDWQSKGIPVFVNHKATRHKNFTCWNGSFSLHMVARMCKHRYPAPTGLPQPEHFPVRVQSSAFQTRTPSNVSQCNYNTCTLMLEDCVTVIVSSI